MKPVLREYQESALARSAALLESVRSVLLVSPTGSGKTVIAAELIRRNEGKNILFLAPRRELIHQTCRKLDDVEVKYGVVLAGDKRTNLYSQVQVASVDTLVSRTLRRNSLRFDFQLVIVDEAHVGITTQRQRLLGLWPAAQIIGLTATPTRADGKALGSVYEELVEVSTPAALTELGFLVPARYFSVSKPDLRAVRTTAGDYNLGDLSATMNKPKLVGDIVEHWMRHAASRRTAVFASSIAHSVALATEFVQHGVAAEHVDANTPQLEREAIFARFSSGSTQVLTNCTLASLGFDLPELDCVVLARPTKSLGLYLQMLGRGLRPARGKQDCLVLDHAGVVHRHGFATDERYWTLHGTYAQDQRKVEKAKQEREERDVVDLTCPQCAAVWRGSRTCPSCNYTFPPKAKTLETVKGSLIEINGHNRPATTLERRQFYLELYAYAQMKGWKPGFAAMKYKDKFEEWPVWAWHNEAQQSHADGRGASPSLEVCRWVKSQQLQYRNSLRSSPPADSRPAMSAAKPLEYDYDADLGIG